MTMIDLQIENTKLKMANIELQSMLMQKEHDALAEKLEQLEAQKAAESKAAE